MSWNDVWKIVLAAVTSVGGVSAIIIFSVKFASNIIAKRLEDIYSKKLERELEKYKSELDKKNYVSKARFDKEFIIYQELSEKTLILLKETAQLKIIDLQVNQEDLKRYIELTNLIEDYIITNAKYAPFIPKKIYCSFIEIGDSLMHRIRAIQKAINEAKENNEKKAFVKDDNLEDVTEKAIDELREYLSNLDVKE